MKASVYYGVEVHGGLRYHVANILPAASKGTLLALVVDPNEQGLSAKGARTIVILEALNVVSSVLEHLAQCC